MQVKISHQLFERAQKSIPGGVNSPVRAFKSVGLKPLFIRSGKGSKITDVDGNSYIDYVGSWGPLILGHAHEEILAAIQKVMRDGTSFGAPTEAEIIMAERVKEAVPSIELLRLVNSGSEATMGAIRAARGYTGRDKVIKFAGCFHGSVDYLLIKAGSGATTLGVPDSKGVPQAFAELTLLAEFNDLEHVHELLDMHQSEVAAIIVEPIPGNMGMILPDLEFLKGLRSLCDQHNTVLIFDEVMSGFRVDFGGAQALYRIEPDLTTFGKVIGGGLPVGAYGGRQDIMLAVAPVGPVYQAGTLSGNPLAVAAGLKQLELLKNPQVYRELGQKTSWLTEELKSLFEAKGIPLQTNAAGGMFGMFLSPEPVVDYTMALQSDSATFNKIFRLVLERGVYLPPSAFEAMFMSTAHSDDDLEQTRKAFKEALEAL